MNRHIIAKLEGNLSVNFFNQDDCVIAYAPALDLSSYGSNEKEAQKNFSEALDAFLDSFTDAREIDQLLQSLGWKKQDSSWEPPKIKQTQLSLKKEVLA